MTNAAKWEEFLRWWEEARTPLLCYTSEGIIDEIDIEIKKLQKSGNARQ